MKITGGRCKKCRRIWSNCKCKLNEEVIAEIPVEPPPTEPPPALDDPSCVPPTPSIDPSNYIEVQEPPKFQPPTRLKKDDDTSTSDKIGNDVQSLIWYPPNRSIASAKSIPESRDDSTEFVEGRSPARTSLCSSKSDICTPEPSENFSSQESSSVWDDERITKYKTLQIKLPDVRPRHLYDESKTLRSGITSIYEYTFNRTLIPTTIVHYSVYNGDSAKKVAQQLSFLVHGHLYHQPQDASQNIYRDSQINNIPTIFYAVYSRDVAKVEKWLIEGADPNSIATLEDLFDSKDNDKDEYEPVPVKIPVLAFAILLEEPEIVRVLLSFGANPSVIPDILRLPYIKPAIYKVKTPEEIATGFIENISQQETTKWCNDAVVFNHLRRTTNLSIRYDLYRANSFKITARQRQFAKNPWSKTDYTSLFGIRFDIVGQDFAIKKILQEMLRWNEMNKRLSYCGEGEGGPNSHGKREMAFRMAKYLSTPLYVCGADIQCQTDPLDEDSDTYEETRLLRSFLEEHVSRYATKNEIGKRLIVFIEDSEKMSDEVRNSLFVESITNGKGINVALDLSKVIWVMATNTLDHIVTAFYNQNQPLTSEKMMGKETRALMSQMRSFISSDTTGFGTHFANHIDTIIPFFPFSKDEQLVLAHRALWGLRYSLLRPICLRNNWTRNRIGNIKLVMEKDYQHCKIIAKSYTASEGARSIRRAVTNLKREIFYHFLESSDEAVSEKDEQEVTEYILKVEKEEEVILVETGNIIPKEDL
ncbi:uncharacterized protein DFL_009705 [Arthrobotrys flagrans]|uniref:ATPase AAA-type core domain-containing protein n=1 Tax=Arthrobotrys flagrans TaxID=97331 RepID=A0A436ZSK7_ARTFL|nr:hypothetical protein DFL_009705 [Arthrobotrys flagrans]